MSLSDRYTADRATGLLAATSGYTIQADILNENLVMFCIQRSKLLAISDLMNNFQHPPKLSVGLHRNMPFFYFIKLNSVK